MKLDGTQYRRVYCDIITEIYCGKWKKGDALPNLETLCEQYGIGRNTARSAIQLLEENGYIVRCGRKQPVICFDWENKERRGLYLEELTKRKQAVFDVFQYMTTAMPEMFSRIIVEITEQERKEVTDMLETYIAGLRLCSEREMSDGLIQIYMKVISFLDNELLENLFYSLYYFIQVPVETETRGNLKFKAAITLIKFMMQRFRRQVETKNVDELKEQIRFFCQGLKQSTGGYLNRICKGVEVEEQQEYAWVPQNNTEYLLLAVDIINKINRGIYQAKDILPSYAQLAKENGVSEKTSRNAVKILNEWKIVTTVNGVGSRVNTFGKEERGEIIQNEIVRENIKRFFEALQIFALTCRPVVMYSIANKREEEFPKPEDELSYEKVIGFLFRQNVSPAVESIYMQLSNILKWGSLLELCGMQLQEKTENPIHSILQKKNGKILAERIYCDAVRYYTESKRFWEEIN